MNVFICCTPIQIVRAVYMKIAMTEFQDMADIYVAPVFHNAPMIMDNLQTSGLFHAVYSLETAELTRAASARLLYGCNQLARQIRSASYQKIIAFNIDSPFINVLYTKNRHNKDFEYHYVEDAPGMYKMYAPAKFPSFSPNKLLQIQQPYYHAAGYWFSYPDFMETPGVDSPSIRKLPSVNIEDDTFVDLINQIFDYAPDETLNNADVLIMEESFYTDGKIPDNYDYTLFQEIRNRFPESKIAIKLHPRTKVNRFEQDFSIVQGTWIPWELYVMNGLRQKQHFPIQLGIACSALTSDKFMFDAESLKIILAPLFQDKITKFEDGSSNVDTQVIRRFEELRKTYQNPERMIIAYNKSDLFDTLTSWLNQ